MKTMQISTSTCETVYVIDGLTVRLWIIVGGTPALGIDYSPYVQRFPVVEKYKVWNEATKSYPHQDQKNMVGPTPEDCLPEGWKTVENFVKEQFPLYQLAQTRVKNLPVTFPITSRRRHDKEEGTYVTAELSNARFSVPCITFSSKVYAGRCEEKVTLFPQWWQDAQKLFNEVRGKTGKLWSEITECEYDEICELLRNLKPQDHS
jgi:hypothetical protein